MGNRDCTVYSGRVLFQGWSYLPARGQQATPDRKLCCQPNCGTCTVRTLISTQKRNCSQVGASTIAFHGWESDYHVHIIYSIQVTLPKQRQMQKMMHLHFFLSCVWLCYMGHFFRFLRLEVPDASGFHSGGFGQRMCFLVVREKLDYHVFCMQSMPWDTILSQDMVALTIQPQRCWEWRSEEISIMTLIVIMSSKKSKEMEGILKAMKSPFLATMKK